MNMIPHHADAFADREKVSMRQITEDGHFKSWLVEPKQDGLIVSITIGRRFM